jgi:hypothetical protein
MKDPFDFLVRWDSPAGPDDKSMLVNLQKEGAVMKVSDGLSQLKPGSVEADLNPVPHVQLYSRFMHLMADAYSKKVCHSRAIHAYASRMSDGKRKRKRGGIKNVG